LRSSKAILSLSLAVLGKHAQALFARSPKTAEKESRQTHLQTPLPPRALTKEQAQSEAEGRNSELPAPCGQNPKPSLDKEVTTARSRRQRRCYHRVISGIERGGQLRLLTLTSSPDSPEDIHRSFRALVLRLKRRGLLKGYIQVPELTKSGLQHKHVLFRGSYIEQQLISHWWQEIHKARVVDIRKVNTPSTKGRIAGYMAKYMAKDMIARYSWDWGWVWKGFVKGWKALYRYWRDEEGKVGGFAVLLNAWRNALRDGPVKELIEALLANPP
jgi:hypothetical protein